jgi:hypothetical protein
VWSILVGVLSGIMLAWLILAAAIWLAKPDDLTLAGCAPLRLTVVSGFGSSAIGSAVIRRDCAFPRYGLSSPFGSGSIKDKIWWALGDRLPGNQPGRPPFTRPTGAYFYCAAARRLFCAIFGVSDCHGLRRSSTMVSVTFVDLAISDAGTRLGHAR